MSSSCAQCGGAERGVMVTQEHEGKRWRLCGRCWLQGINKPRPPDDLKLPAPGSLAGVLPSTGEAFYYTDEVIDLATGKRKKR